jgi:hypothetical protein
MATFTSVEGRETALQMVRTVRSLAEMCQKKAEKYTFFLIEPYHDPRMKKEELIIQKLKCLYKVVKDFTAIFQINREISLEDQVNARKLYIEYAIAILEIKIFY